MPSLARCQMLLKYWSCQGAYFYAKGLWGLLAFLDDYNALVIVSPLACLFLWSCLLCFAYWMLHGIDLWDVWTNASLKIWRCSIMEEFLMWCMWIDASLTIDDGSFSWDDLWWILFWWCLMTMEVMEVWIHSW